METHRPFAHNSARRLELVTVMGVYEVALRRGYFERALMGSGIIVRFGLVVQTKSVSTST